MKARTLSDEYSSWFPRTVLTRDEATRLVPEIATAQNIELLEKYITKANRKMAKIFGLNWRRGRSVFKKAPFYTREQIETIAYTNGLVLSADEAKNFADRFLCDKNMKNGTSNPFERYNGSFLTDDLLASRHAALERTSIGGVPHYRLAVQRITEVVY